MKALAISILAAILLSAFQFLAAMKFSFNILWQVTIMQMLAGPCPLLGYDSSGQPMYEGTPVHILAAYFGLLFGVAIYAVLIYQYTKRRHNHTIKAVEK